MLIVVLTGIHPIKEVEPLGPERKFRHGDASTRPDPTAEAAWPQPA
jgi:hypothetical protein